MAYPSNVETLPTNHFSGQVIDPQYDNDQARILNAIQAQLVSGGTHDLPGHETAHPTFSGTEAAGTQLYRGSSAYVHAGRVFSASAYGVVGDNNNATAGANQTAMMACIDAAESAGAGSVVLLDWIGTAYFEGNLELRTNLVYHSRGFGTISKLKNSATAGTHVWCSENFNSLRGTSTVSTGVPYGFTLSGDWLIDGNKDNNASGGCGLAIYGYEFRITGTVIAQECKSSGMWFEYGSTNEPVISGFGNRRQRAAKIHKIESWNSDCAQISGVGGAAIVLKGPVDTEIDSIECVRDDSVAGTGVLFGSGSASTVVHQLTHWLNFDIGVDVQAGDVRIVQIHSEGANTNVRVAAGEFKISGGEIFGPQAAGTNLHFVSGNFNHINVNMPSCSSGGTFINFAGGNIDSEINITASEGQAVNTTLASGTLPNARVLSVTGNNYGAGTMTGGLIPEISTGVFKLFRTNGPAQLQDAARLYSGSGAPASGLGSDGDFYFRTGTPSTANQRLYVKASGSWSGIL